MLERWLSQRLLPYLAAALALAAALVGKLLLGTQTAILILAGAALIAIILLFWSSLQSLTGTAPLTLEEALSMGAPRAEEEQKRAVLRALKDLEYERSVGKLSDEDYRELSSRYRAEAKRLIRALDEEQAPLRQQVETLVLRRLVKAPRAAAAATEPTDKADEPAAVPEPTVSATKPTPKAPTRLCAGCDTRNELDALFCKRCGKRQAGESELLCSACPAVYDRNLSQCPECGVAAEAV